MKILKIIVFTLALLLAFFMPILPATLIDNNDPISIKDKRVLANISDGELKDILYLVRGDLGISTYEILFLEPRHSVLNISKSEATILRGGKNNKPPTKVFAAVGKVTVIIGLNCDDSCSGGNNFYLDIISGEWVILKKSQWFT